MRAVVVKTPGGLDQLQLAELPEPSAGPGEVLVAVAYCGLNWADTMIRVGTYPHPFTYPVVPGLEVSGLVAAVGAGVTCVRPGDRVAGFTEKGGGYAERCVVRQEWLIKLPDAMHLAVAAAFPIQALTAWHMLHTIGRSGPGKWVLVHAIGGGVGLYCTQLGVRAGARVIGTVGAAAKRQRALDYGATWVADRGSEDFVAGAMQVTGGRGVDLLIDSLGAATLDRSFEAMCKLGHVISIGESEGTPYPNIRERLLPRSLTFTRFHLGHVDPSSPAMAAGVADVVTGILDGSLRVPIEQTYPLTQASAMQARMEGRQLSGKLLLAVGDPPD